MDSAPLTWRRPFRSGQPADLQRGVARRALYRTGAHHRSATALSRLRPRPIAVLLSWGCRSLGLVELTATYVELEAYVRAESRAGRGSRLGELEKADRYALRIDLSTGP